MAEADGTVVNAIEAHLREAKAGDVHTCVGKRHAHDCRFFALVRIMRCDRCSLPNSTALVPACRSRFGATCSCACTIRSSRAALKFEQHVGGCSCCSKYTANHAA